MKLGALVEAPRGRPWIPPPPPLELDTPIILPDRATLERAIDGLKNLSPATEAHP